MFRIHLVLLLSSALLVQACSSAKVRIMPGEDGTNEVISADRERNDAEVAAAEKAKEYCEEQGKQMVVVKEQKTAYKGSMDESTRDGMRRASKAAVILGGHGSPVQQAGMAGYSVTNERDYEARFQFRCK